MNENLRPGPKRNRRRAADGTQCPPGSEGHRVYRGLKPYFRYCRQGHPKPHPGRCLICRRASDKARDANPERLAIKARASKKWHAKPGSKEKIAAWAKRRNARAEQKAKAAERMREYRHREVIAQVHAAMRPAKPSPKISALLKLAEAKAAQAAYGITRVAYQEVR